jgi:fumarate hydratase class II
MERLKLIFRSILNFQIGDDAELMPKEIITAMVTIKKAAAKVNSELSGLPLEISEAIQKAADEVKKKGNYKMAHLFIPLGVER